MKEIDYNNVANLVKVRAAIAIIRDCVFLDIVEEKRCQCVVTSLCWLEWMTGKKIKVVSVLDNIRNKNEDVK